MKETDFHCRRCGNCCRWHGYVRLSEAETERAAACLGLEVGEFTARYTTLTADRRGLTLTEREDGSCIFLETGPDGATDCRIQAAKPQQCLRFPWGWNFPGWEQECAGAAAAGTGDEGRRKR